MDRATSQAMAERTTVWSETPDISPRARLPKRSAWGAVKDPLFTLAAVATILACVFGVGPFERPHGSHETFLASPAAR